LSGGGSQEQTGDEQDVKKKCRLNIIRHLSRSVEKMEKETKRLRSLVEEVKCPLEKFRPDGNENVKVEVIEIDQILVVILSYSFFVIRQVQLVPCPLSSLQISLRRNWGLLIPCHCLFPFVYVCVCV